MAKAQQKKKVMKKSKTQKANTAPHSSMNEMMSAIGNEWAGTADKVLSTDSTFGVNTGSYTVNSLFSGSLFEGIASGKIYGIAGESQSGKSYLIQAIFGQFLRENPKGRVVLFDSEAAYTSASIKAWAGEHAKRVAVLPVATWEEFRGQSIKCLDWFIKQGKNAPPCIMALDSMGMLTSSTELANSVKEIDKMNTNMGVLAKLAKGTFRQLTLKCAIAQIPMLVTCHTTPNLAGPGADAISGGRGLLYASDHILCLSASQEKSTDGERIGVWVKARCYKSRKIKAGKLNSILINFTTGLDTVSGLDDLAIEAGVFKKVGSKVRLPDGNEKFASKLLISDYSQDTLNAIDAWTKENYRFGVGAGIAQKDFEVNPETGELLDEDEETESFEDAINNS
jgi:hypothetical protein